MPDVTMQQLSQSISDYLALNSHVTDPSSSHPFLDESEYTTLIDLQRNLNHYDDLLSVILKSNNIISLLSKLTSNVHPTNAQEQLLRQRFLQLVLQQLQILKQSTLTQWIADQWLWQQSTSLDKMCGDIQNFHDHCKMDTRQNCVETTPLIKKDDFRSDSAISVPAISSASRFFKWSSNLSIFKRQNHYGVHASVSNIRNPLTR